VLSIVTRKKEDSFAAGASITTSLKFRSGSSLIAWIEETPSGKPI
jgi:hypothetical protein